MRLTEKTMQQTNYEKNITHEWKLPCISGQFIVGKLTYGHSLFIIYYLGLMQVFSLYGFRHTNFSVVYRAAIYLLVSFISLLNLAQILFFFKSRASILFDNLNYNLFYFIVFSLSLFHSVVIWPSDGFINWLIKTIWSTLDHYTDNKYI